MAPHWTLVPTPMCPPHGGGHVLPHAKISNGNPVAYCLLHDANYMLQIACCKLYIANCKLHIANCMFKIARTELDIA